MSIIAKTGAHSEQLPHFGYGLLWQTNNGLLSLLFCRCCAGASCPQQSNVCAESHAQIDIWWSAHACCLLLLGGLHIRQWTVPLQLLAASDGATKSFTRHWPDGNFKPYAMLQQTLLQLTYHCDKQIIITNETNNILLLISVQNLGSVPQHWLKQLKGHVQRGPGGIPLPFKQCTSAPRTPSFRSKGPMS